MLALLERRASRRSSPSTARSAPAATSRRSRHCALALIGEGEVVDADGARRPGRRGARRGRARAARRCAPRRAWR